MASEGPEASTSSPSWHGRPVPLVRGENPRTAPTKVSPPARGRRHRGCHPVDIPSVPAGCASPRGYAGCSPASSAVSKGRGPARLPAGGFEPLKHPRSVPRRPRSKIKQGGNEGLRRHGQGKPDSFVSADFPWTGSRGVTCSQVPVPRHGSLPVPGRGHPLIATSQPPAARITTRLACQSYTACSSSKK